MHQRITVWPNSQPRRLLFRIKRDRDGLTLAGDLVSSSGYFALLGAVPGDRTLAAGAALGLAAGLGAVYLPGPLGLSTRPTDRGVATRAITVALYGAGGLAAGTAYRALPA